MSESRPPAALAEFRGQPAVALRAPDGATAIVLLHGAQVVSWQPAAGGERLYLSDRARYGDGASVRGGMPVVVPQFNERGPLPRHGLARTRPWQLARAEVGADDALAVLTLADDEASRAVWPQRFALELTVRAGGDRLDVELAVTNTGEAGFEFTAALHTYLRVAEVDTVRLAGLKGLRYEDFTDRTMHVEAQSELRLDGETDRIYFDVGTPLVLREPGRRLRIEAERFPDAVIWNPGQARAAALADVAAGDFRRFVCVEAALIGRPMPLAPGAEWWGRQSQIAE